MTYFDTIAVAISDDQPCGPDLSSDHEFSSFIVAAEGVLPRKFFEFSKSNLKLNEQIQSISSLLERSRDLRLLVIAAKFFALAGDLVGFADAVKAMDALVEERWDDFHPQAQDGDYMLRMNYLSSLDDMSTCILPLQYAPLVATPRFGTISFRSSLVASGQAQLRDKEIAVDKATILNSLSGTNDLDGLKRIYDGVSAADDALARIRTKFQESAGYEQSPSFERVKPLLSNLRQLLQDALRERDPTLIGLEKPAEDTVQTPDASSAGETAGAVSPKASTAAALAAPKTAADAVRALKAAEQFFAAREPSNLAVLLLRQAQLLAGKSFVDAMQALTPTLMDKATVRIGGEPPLTLTMAQLKTLIDPKAAAESGSPVESAIDYSVTSRNEAAKVMDLAGQFYKQQEPSSPIPMLVARAMQCIDKDFAALVRDITKPPGT